MKKSSSNRFEILQHPVTIVLIIIIVVLGGVLYAISTEGKQKFKKLAMDVYDMQVESPLMRIAYSGVNSMDEAGWDDTRVRMELYSLFYAVERGIRHIKPLTIENVIPERISTLLKPIEENFIDIGRQLMWDEPLSEETKEEILAISKAINTCRIESLNDSWDQVEEELTCLHQEWME